MLLRQKATALAVVALMAAACGVSSTADTEEATPEAASSFVVQGEDGLEEAPPSSSTSTAPAEGAAGAAEGDPAEVPEDATSDTLPQNEDDSPAAATLFEALAVFTGCLSDEGHEFIGRPDDTAEADDPVNDPGYGEALGKCAAISQIAEAFQAMQDESDDLDAEGIEERNRQLVHWTDCMEGRGWVIDGISTDDRGLNQPTGLTPPGEQSLLESADMGECATVAGEAYEAELAAEGDAG